MDHSENRGTGWILWPSAVYAAALVVRYFLPPHVPRFQVESAYFIFVGLGVLAVLIRPGGRRARLAAVDADDFRSRAFVTLLFVAGALILYAPAVRMGLLSDDYVIAEWARRLELVHVEATGFLRPGVPLFWAMLNVLPGDLATAAHLANIVLHGFNAALVALIALRFDLRPEQALAAGAMFMAFPGLSEAIVWASGVQDVLMTTFGLTAVALASARPPNVVGAVFATICAVLVKETAVVIPALAALIIAGRTESRFSRPDRIVVASLAVVVTAYVIARLASGVPSSFLTVDDWRYFLKQLVAGSFATLGAPWTDDWWRRYPALALSRALVIVSLMAAAFYQWRRHDQDFRKAVACTAWVLVAVLPVFSLFYVGPNLEGARYVYLSAAGFSLLLAILAGTATHLAGALRRRVILVIVVGLLAAPLVASISSDLHRWQRAADVRDVLLARVKDDVDRLKCTTFTVDGDADSVSGAYVFRHGLTEALALPSRSPAVPCRITAAGDNVVVQLQP